MKSMAELVKRHTELVEAQRVATEAAVAFSAQEQPDPEPTPPGASPAVPALALDSWGGRPGGADPVQ